jgi:apolipoprotein N-acyltransferase
MSGSIVISGMLLSHHMKKNTIKHTSPPVSRLPYQRVILLTVFSALLSTAAFPNIDIWVLAWISLVPLFYVLGMARPIGSFLAGALFGFLHMIGLAYWIFNAIYFNTGAGFLVSILFLVLVIGLFSGLYYGFFALAAARIIQSCSPWYLKTVYVASAWVCTEYVRAYLFSGMPWELFGYSQYRWLGLIQVADITGVYGISFVLVFANCSIYQACSVWPDIRKSTGIVLPAIGLVAVVLFYGFFSLSLYPAQPATHGDHKTGIIQCSILQDERWQDGTQDMQVARYIANSDEAFRQGAKLIVWPEAALQTYLQEQIPDSIIQRLAQNNGALLIGGPRYIGHPGDYIFYNSAFLLTKNGIVQFYDKIHLLPFGEYFPFGFIDVLRNRYAGPRQYSEGRKYTVLATPEGKLGTLLCFEIIFPELVRGFVKNGAEIIMNISNDAWFGRTSAHYQHFSMAVFRAVEFRRPVLRSANTGISGYIDAAGHIVQQLDPFQEGVIICSPAPGHGESFYCRYGDLFACVCMGGFLFFLFFKRQGVHH